VIKSVCLTVCLDNLISCRKISVMFSRSMADGHGSSMIEWYCVLMFQILVPPHPGCLGKLAVRQLLFVACGTGKNWLMLHRVIWPIIPIPDYRDSSRSPISHVMGCFSPMRYMRLTDQVLFPVLSVSWMSCVCVIDEDEDEVKPSVVTSKHVSLEVQVPSHAVGAVIGQQGSQIKQVSMLCESTISHYLHQQGYVFTCVCLSVCLSVCFSLYLLTG